MAPGSATLQAFKPLFSLAAAIRFAQPSSSASSSLRRGSATAACETTRLLHHIAWIFSLTLGAACCNMRSNCEHAVPGRGRATLKVTHCRATKEGEVPCNDQTTMYLKVMPESRCNRTCYARRRLLRSPAMTDRDHQSCSAVASKNDCKMTFDWAKFASVQSEVR